MFATQTSFRDTFKIDATIKIEAFHSLKIGLGLSLFSLSLSSSCNLGFSLSSLSTLLGQLLFDSHFIYSLKGLPRNNSRIGSNRNGLANSFVKVGSLQIKYGSRNDQLAFRNHDQRAHLIIFRINPLVIFRFGQLLMVRFIISLRLRIISLDRRLRIGSTFNPFDVSRRIVSIGLSLRIDISLSLMMFIYIDKLPLVLIGLVIDASISSLLGGCISCQRLSISRSSPIKFSRSRSFMILFAIILWLLGRFSIY